MTRGDNHSNPGPPSRGDRDNRDRGPPPGGRYDAPPRDHRSDRRRDHRGDYRDNRRGGGGRRGPPRPRNGIIFNSFEEEMAWVEERRRKRIERKSLFDVEPTEEQIALEELQKAALASHGPNPNVFLKPDERAGVMSAGISSAPLQPQQTRHARRLYVGQVSPDLSDQQVHNFFRDSVYTAMGIVHPTPGDDPILSVYINKERHFAFVEFTTMDVTTACLAFNGMDMSGRGNITIKRPNDYNPANAPGASAEFMNKFDVSKLGIVSSIVTDSPNKIFIGGLPYHLADAQVMELLEAFGKIKAFHLVKSDSNAVTSKGYCFVQYADETARDIAILGLNGMDMGGGKVLSAKIASERAEGEGAEIGTAAIAGALAVMPIVPSGDGMASSGACSIAPPVMNFVDGINVEALVDVAMGNSSMRNRAPAPAPESHGVLDIANAALQAAYSANNQASRQANASVGNGSQTQSRILVLHNMASDEDFATSEDYEGLKDEVKEECQKFGSLISIKIPHPKVRVFEFCIVCEQLLVFFHSTTCDFFSLSKYCRFTGWHCSICSQEDILRIRNTTGCSQC